MRGTGTRGQGAVAVREESAARGGSLNQLQRADQCRQWLAEGVA